ncbi:ParM/StbA family protein [Clostridium sardiniense]|uniref:ParM/StbA family protein n=1 Tax=Clostridium sardiniense TaxID=29369 RepID=UPI0019563B50|nr:ParM/StbA family protein [Clostridium sardiniense]MBM7836454.1 plasmid segregation protein ParM [Clostridium sardiniense]
MRLGIDVGYSHTKVIGENVEFTFKSTIEEGALDIGNSIRVDFDGKTYTVGEQNGLYATEINKMHSLNFKICLYTAIAKAMKNKTTEEIQLVTGLPAQYYQAQKEDLIKELQGKKITITLNDEPKRFTITDVIVFPQSAGVLLLEPNKLKGDVCVIDIGGFTVDVSYFNNKKLRKLHTLELGMNVLANTLVQKIKAEYGVSYDVLKADDILDTNEIVRNGKAINIETLIDEVLESHTRLIENRLKGLQEYNLSKHIFVGGGALRLAKFLDIEIDTDTVYTNAKAYYKIGCEKFEG